jgi:phosphoenolpyruvate---glycerone phosphotransferase subunit DhaM
MDECAVLLVSHSRSLAEGVRELALQMAHGGVNVGAAGGTDEGGIGTSALLIADSLRTLLGRAKSVVVLMDLGSAYLNTMMAGEMLDAGSRARVELADAPLVEGAVLAVVAAAAGESGPDVRARAEEAREMRKII